ncbi:MAG: transposase [Candidatus Moraniibacteriota bacterium]
MRKFTFAEGEFYHLYNRGTDKRIVFTDESDFSRFLQSLVAFNTPEPIGSIYEHSFRKPLLGSRTSKSPARLVDVVAYCLNPNHYHLLVKQVHPEGVEKFMHRLGTGYTKYFNERHDRSGALFQGKFKAVHVQSNEQLLHVSAYINLNYLVHQLGSSTSKSSWLEYIGGATAYYCVKEDILGQMGGGGAAYRTFAENAVQGTRERRAPHPLDLVFEE